MQIYDGSRYTAEKETAIIKKYRGSMRLTNSKKKTQGRWVDGEPISM